MKIVACAILFFVFISFNSFSPAEELNFPLPPDAVKTNEKIINTGPLSSLTQSYTTSFPQERLSSFFKKEMLKSGWEEQKGNFFLKERDMAILVVLPSRGKDKKTRFDIITSRMPTKEELLSGSKDNPDKLDFMPVYPGSKQVFLWNTETGISASYETSKNIKDVVFFYKSGMINYGWSLSGETPVETKQIDDCPECRKKAGVSMPEGVVLPEMKSISSNASLTFRKGSGESCAIKLYQTSLTSLPENEYSSKTTILVTYAKNRQRPF